MNQWSTRHIYNHLKLQLPVLFTKMSTIYNGEKKVSLTNGVRKIRYPHAED